MNWEEILRKFANEPSTSLKRVYGIADDLRRVGTFLAFLGCMHFVVLLVVHGLLQKSLFSSANSIWGTLWVLLLIIGFIMFGGWPAFGLLAEAASGDSKAVVVFRVLVAFIAIETFVNILFAVIPFHAAPLMFLALPSMLGCYFLLRVLAGLPIDWGRWAKVPLVNIAVVVISIMYSGRADYNQLLPNNTFGWLGSQISFLADPAIWLLVLVIAGVLWSLKGGYSNAHH